MLDQAQVTTTLAVTDIKRAKEFYGNMLGLREVKDVGMKDGAMFRVGNQNICLYRRPTPSGSTATVCSFEVDDVEGVVMALQGKGVRFEEYDLPEMGIKTRNGIASLGDGRSAWFKDPDGNILAIGNTVRTGKDVHVTTSMVTGH